MKDLETREPDTDEPGMLCYLFTRHMVGIPACNREEYLL